MFPVISIFKVFKRRLGLHSFIILLFECFLSVSYAQNREPRVITLSNAINTTLKNNPLAKNANLSIQAATAQKAGIPEFGVTSFNYGHGQINSALKDNYFEINQDFGSPFSIIQKKNVVKQQIQLSKTNQQITVLELTAKVKTAWFQWIFSLNKLSLIKNESVYYDDYFNKAGLNEPNDSNLLEQIVAETKYAGIQNNLFQADQDFKLATNQLKQLMFSDDDILPADTILELYAIQTNRDGADKFSPATHIACYQEDYLLKTAENKLEYSKYLPGISAGYFNQQINNVKGFKGWQIGVSVPLWFLPQRAKIKESAILRDMAANELEYQKFNFEKRIENLKIQLDQLFVQITFYRENALKQADLLEQASLTAFNKQTLTYSEFLENIKNAYSIRQSYIEKLLNYNVTAVELENLVN